MGNTIYANGESTLSIAGDGAGGGGAGGSVLLEINHYSGTITVDVSGGNGGNVDNLANESCNGPGGGGSGGILWVSNAATPIEINSILTSGSSGKTLRTGQSNCTVDGTNGATKGSDGFILNDLSLPHTLPIPTTKNAFTICYGDSLFLNGAWQSESGIYYDTIISGCRDSIISTTLQILKQKLGNIDTTICKGESILINGRLYDSTISGAVEVFQNIGPQQCDSVVTINLTVEGVDTTVTNNSPTLSANAIGASYQWIDCRLKQLLSGETNQSFIANTIGQYAVIVTQNGCSDTSVCFLVTGAHLNPRIKIYPNPTNGSFTIDLGLKVDATSVEITDVIGQTILSKQFSDSRFLLVEFDGASAMYLVTIETPKLKTTKRLLKE